jgi:hypothetical protein
VTVTASATDVVRLTAADLQDALALQRLIVAEVPAGHLFAKSDDDLRAYLDGERGLAFGIRGALPGRRDALVALSLLRLVLAEQPADGPKFPRVPEDEWARRACFLENTIVHPDRRKRGLHPVLLDARLAAASERGCRWFCSGVHFDNQRSWSNLLVAGLAIVGIRVDIGYPAMGLLRAADPEALATDPHDERLVAADDLAAHQAALAEDRIGVRRLADGRVVYRRLAAPGRVA